MKNKLIFLVIYFLVSLASAQNIKYIVAYENNSSTTSGLYAVGDTAIYRYSWYYQEWFPLSNNGLVKINDTVQVNAIAVYNNESSNSSGLFVFSDTAVYNYNWITMQWYPLSNNGLPRINQKPDVKMLAVYGPTGSSSNSTLFALTDTAVFRYSWSYQEWTSLSNAGIVNMKNEENTDSNYKTLVYPNPFSSMLTFEVQIPETGSETIEVSVFDVHGRLILTEKFNVERNAMNLISLDFKNQKTGLYFCELYDGKNFKQLKVIKVD